MLRRALILGTALLLLAPAVPASPTVFDNDAGSGQDAGDTNATALAIGPGSYSGRLIFGPDNSDWYSFTATAGQGIGVDLNGLRAGFADLSPPYANLHGPSGELYYLYDGSRQVADSTGTWFLEIRLARLSCEGPGPGEQQGLRAHVRSRRRLGRGHLKLKRTCGA